MLYAHKRINRIRLEFKADLIVGTYDTYKVLIESDWNLKFLERSLNGTL